MEIRTGFLVSDKNAAASPQNVSTKPYLVFLLLSLQEKNICQIVLLWCRVLWLAVRVLNTCAHWPTLPVDLGDLLPSPGVGINLKDSQRLQGSRGRNIQPPGVRVWRGLAMSTSPCGPLVFGGTPHKSGYLGNSGPPGKAPRRLTSWPLAPPASRPREETPAFSPWSCSDSQPSSSWMPDSQKEGMK